MDSVEKSKEMERRNRGSSENGSVVRGMLCWATRTNDAGYEEKLRGITQTDPEDGQVQVFLLEDKYQKEMFPVECVTPREQESENRPRSNGNRYDSAGKFCGTSMPNPFGQYSIGNFRPRFGKNKKGNAERVRGEPIIAVNQPGVLTASSPPRFQHATVPVYRPLATVNGGHATISPGAYLQQSVFEVPAECYTPIVLSQQIPHNYPLHIHTTSLVDGMSVDQYFFPFPPNVDWTLLSQHACDVANAPVLDESGAMRKAVYDFALFHMQYYRSCGRLAHCFNLHGFVTPVHQFQYPQHLQFFTQIPCASIQHPNGETVGYAQQSHNSDSDQVPEDLRTKNRQNVNENVSKNSA